MTIEHLESTEGECYDTDDKENGDFQVLNNDRGNVELKPDFKILVT